MDDKRFDSLTRLFGRGASRRSILKGLLGLGGAAVTATVAEESAEARTLSLTRIPRPPDPACPSGQQLCSGKCCPYGRCFDGVCCPTAGTSRCGNGCCLTGQCTSAGGCCAPPLEVCGSICCPTGTCTRNGITDVCCTEGFVCGPECCADELQCCDGECCPDGTVCLVRAFGAESPLIEEETCCPVEQTCDGQCCTGDCFWPVFIIVGTADDDDIDVGLFQRTCCPDEPGFEFCPGSGLYEGFGACCTGEFPNCCQDASGRPRCIPEGTCCTDADCPGCETCEEGVCTALCSACCEIGDPADWFCQPGECCPGVPGSCGAGQTCCPEAGPGLGTTCGECCSDDDCTGCETCEAGVCTAICSACCEIGDPADWFCQPGECCPGVPDSCGAGQTCCPEAGPGLGTTCGACCSNDDCTGCETCEAGVCTALCSACCEIGDPADWFCMAGECCPDGTFCHEEQVCCAEAQSGFGTTCEECCVDTDCPACNRCYGGSCLSTCTASNACETCSCATGTCVCDPIPGCCLDDDGCGAETPHCNTTTNTCVQCLDTIDCGSLNFDLDCLNCADGACVTLTDIECSTESCTGGLCGYCSTGICTPCRDNGEACTKNAHCCSNFCGGGSCAVN